MKAILSYAANPEKQQFSFFSPKSSILPRVICNLDDPLQIGSSDWDHFFFCLVCGYVLKNREEKKKYSTNEMSIFGYSACSAFSK